MIFCRELYASHSNQTQCSQTQMISSQPAIDWPNEFAVIWKAIVLNLHFISSFSAWRLHLIPRYAVTEEITHFPVLNSILHISLYISINVCV